ncbi:hypothetical protein KC19_VG021000 [Ceratodon purpureus]|uniref:Uncharacterized protein n=1 Tax=Ceratodon purpureus TaxID=3225 RepID=A0A8T0HLJ0_CERPU|nr:hypothetical protein KC19_VG021000 [Ceratodon purpureus]
MTGGQVRLKKRPSLADKKKSTDPSKLFVRPCSPDGSSRSSRKASSDDSGSAKSSTSTFPKKRPKKPRAFSTNSFPKGSRDSSPKSSSRCGSASEGASPKSSRPHSPPGSPKSRSSTSSTFRRWGSPYPPISKNSTRHCSPDYTVVDFEDTGGAFPELKKLIHSKIPRGSPSPELALKFVGGKNPVSKRLLQVMMYAATARAPFPEPKVRKLLFYKNTDKVDLIDQLQSLKAAVADQAYHFQLHKTQLHGLQNEQNELEEKLAALESIDGSNAPRTGGKGRLKSKISGLRVMIGNLTDDITKQKETIQNLKYRYQVSLTREVTIQRDLATGGVWRLQKQEIKLSIEEVEKVSKQFTDESYAHLRAADKAKRRASGLLDEGKRMRAKLNQVQESKRKNQHDVWIIGYDTCMLVKDNRQIERQKKMKEAAIAAGGKSKGSRREKQRGS